MTALRERMINMVTDVSEDQIPRIILFIENIQRTEKADHTDSLKKSQLAYQNLQKYRKRCAANPDYKKEIANAIEEKYESLG